MKLEQISADTIVCGPLTFKRRDNSGDEVWEVALPEDVQATFFCVKNYGGKPNERSAFSGWRVVSGGPFTNAGGWTSRNEAIAGATPWLVARYLEDAIEGAEKARRLEVAMTGFLNNLTSAPT